MRKTNVVVAGFLFLLLCRIQGFAQEPADYAEDTSLASVSIKASDFSFLPCGGAEEGGWNLWSSGFVTASIMAHTNGYYTLVFVARGDEAQGIWPVMRIVINDQVVSEVSVDSTDWASYTVDHEMNAGQNDIKIAFINDFNGDGQDRNLHIASLTIICPQGVPNPYPVSPEDYKNNLRMLNQRQAAKDDKAIETLRKGTLILQVVDADDRPMTNIHVSVQQKKHEFLFGTALCSSAFESTNVTAETQTYLDTAKKYFNHAVPENAMKWTENESVRDRIDYTTADRMVAWCRTNGLSVRGHCVIWGCPEFMPKWVNELKGDALRSALLLRTESIMEHFKGRVDEFDVMNEILHCTALESGLGEKIRKQIYKSARSSNGKAVLYVNDYGILEGMELDRYVEQIKAMIDMGVPVGGIGLQAHCSGAIEACSVRKALDALAAFKLPVKITEFDCAAGTETVQAQSLVDLYRTAFAHPAVEGILMWGFWEKWHWQPKAALWRADFTKKPAAEAYENLVFSNWWTRVEGRTDSRGEFTCKAFYGDYVLTATGTNGQPVIQDFSLHRKKGEGKATLTFAAPKKAESGEE